MAYEPINVAGRSIVLGLSGGVDSAVAAVLLKEAGARVQALHMTNWEDDDGYCTAAEDLQDARQVSEQLDIPLHHVNFSREYRDRVFAHFLDEYRAGRTPNPDVLCNREIKFGVFRHYAKRLGGELLATGHYARTATTDGSAALLKGVDTEKDQSYFLHAVDASSLAETVFPLGTLLKEEVRRIAHDRGLRVHDKKDSTGICFIGERPFRDFLETYIPAQPGPMRTTTGREIGTHAGLMFYTLGQRQGLGIGGRNDASELPWYVVDKNLADNALIVDQGESPWLYSNCVRVSAMRWISGAPARLGDGLCASVKVRYRQDDQRATIRPADDKIVEIDFERPQRAVAPGQYAVIYDGDLCLGGGVIDAIVSRPGVDEPVAAAANS